MLAILIPSYSFLRTTEEPVKSTDLTFFFGRGAKRLSLFFEVLSWQRKTERSFTEVPLAPIPIPPSTTPVTVAMPLIIREFVFTISTLA